MTVRKLWQQGDPSFVLCINKSIHYVPIESVKFSPNLANCWFYNITTAADQSVALSLKVGQVAGLCWVSLYYSALHCSVQCTVHCVHCTVLNITVQCSRDQCRLGLNYPVCQPGWCRATGDGGSPFTTVLCQLA